MSKIFSIFFFLCLASNAFAQSASTDWHGSWGFPNPLEKANALQRAMGMKFVEEGGLTNNYYQQQDCNTDGACRNGLSSTVSIGANVTVNGDGNNVTATNKDSTITAQTNNNSSKNVVSSGKKSLVDQSEGYTDNSSQDDNSQPTYNSDNSLTNTGGGLANYGNGSASGTTNTGSNNNSNNN